MRKPPAPVTETGFVYAHIHMHSISLCVSQYGVVALNLMFQNCILFKTLFLKYYFSNLDFSKVDFFQTGFFKIGFFKIEFFKIGFFKNGFFKIGFSKIGFFKIGFFQNSILKNWIFSKMDFLFFFLKKLVILKIQHKHWIWWPPDQFQLFAQMCAKDGRSPNSI